jgi:FtsP/CotA-like multicopper oxidase with cupredoxin domain
LDLADRKGTRPLNAGEHYDAILGASNPGTWMLHCHNFQHMGENASGRHRRVVVS